MNFISQAYLCLVEEWRTPVAAFLPAGVMFRFLKGQKTFLCFQWMDPGLKLSRALESWELRQKRG